MSVYPVIPTPPCRRFTLLVAAISFFLTYPTKLQYVTLSSAEPLMTENGDKIGILTGRTVISALILPPGNDIAKQLEDTNNRAIGAASNQLVSFTQELAPMNSDYPGCPMSCLSRWIGDGWCDTPCAIDACGNDGGDCEGWCAPDCKSTWIDDGYCDIDCFRPECTYDGNDCNNNYTRGDIIFPFPNNDVFDYSSCPETCNKALLNNGVCDASCLMIECNQDGGDCRHQCSSTCTNSWLGDGECDIGCNNEACGFDKNDCNKCAPGCEPGMVGNGICDQQCNNDDCQKDLGDCWGVCWAADKIDYFTDPFFYPHCRTEWRGDGFCDCFCMNKDCQFDYGDCKHYDCSSEFSLLMELNKRMNVSDSSNFPPQTENLPIKQLTTDA